jgi:hypothetical protein
VLEYLSLSPDVGMEIVEPEFWSLYVRTAMMTESECWNSDVGMVLLEWRFWSNIDGAVNDGTELFGP